MPTADDALNLAREQLGKGPDEFVAWYGSGATTSTPWCCIFQSWVSTQIGIPMHYAWVSGYFDAMRAEGRTLAPYLAQPGDHVAFDYDGGGQSSYDHISIVEYVGTDDGGTFMVCLDGNWQNRVQRVKRYYGRSGYGGGIAEIARPVYSSAPTPGPTPPAPSPEEDEMKSVILWDPRTGTAWHLFGNTRVALSNPDQVAALKFLGVQEFNPGSPEWIDSCAILPRNGGINTPGN